MRSGGAYKKVDGKTQLVERTEAHPQGNRPRDEKGKPLNVPVDPAAKAAKTTGAKKS